MTPYTQEAMVYLQDNCACGWCGNLHTIRICESQLEPCLSGNHPPPQSGDPSLWVVGQERTLTSCPNTTCTTDGWYTGDALGSIGYGNIIECVLERVLSSMHARLLICPTHPIVTDADWSACRLREA